MEIREIRTYEYDDKDFSGDALNVELFVDGKSALSGDWYHDKIDEQIEGFLAALKWLNIEYTQITLDQNDARPEYDEEED